MVAWAGFEPTTFGLEAIQTYKKPMAIYLDLHQVCGEMVIKNRKGTNHRG